MQNRYPFPKHQHEVFPLTFLKVVAVSIYFDDINVSEKCKILQKFFKDKFDLEYSESRILNLSSQDEKPIVISNKEKTITFDFHKNCVRLGIKTPVYNSFKNIEDHLPIISEFLSLTDISTIIKTVVFKANELSYSIPASSNLDNAITQIFSKELLEEGNYNFQEIEDKKLASLEKNVIFVDNVSRTITTLVFGFSSLTNKDKGKLILKTLVENNESFESRDLDKNLLDINSIADDAFRWSVTPDVIKAMKGELK